MRKIPRRFLPYRRATQIAFFILFVTAPLLNLFRLDADAAQFYILGMKWSIGIDALAAKEISATQLALQFVSRVFLPVLTLIFCAIFFFMHYGRVFCGWLCPHFSLVELLNHLLLKAYGKLSIWDKQKTYRANLKTSPVYWFFFIFSAILLAYIWTVTILAYVFEPFTIWRQALTFSLSFKKTLFLCAVWPVLTLELIFARHLFCRFGCAFGFFQSLFWMMNPRAMVVEFKRDLARDCKDCESAEIPQGSACDNVCPMRLHPRNIKRMMFACTQCGECLTACDKASGKCRAQPMLDWVIGDDAVLETLRQKKFEDSQNSQKNSALTVENRENPRSTQKNFEI